MEMGTRMREDGDGQGDEVECAAKLTELYVND